MPRRYITSSAECRCMTDDLATRLSRRILIDLARSNAAGALPKEADVKGKQDKLPKSAEPPTGEDMDARLRSIRHYITPKELAALLHCHIGTIYRKIKSGMPADRDVDPQGRGRRLKIYTPQVADWLRGCREALRRTNQLTSSLPSPNREASKSDKVVEWRK
jgi:hypothetical protein